MFPINKKIVYFILIGVLLVVCFITLRLFTPEDTWLCQNGKWIRHGKPATDQPINPCR